MRTLALKDEVIKHANLLLAERSPSHNMKIINATQHGHIIHLEYTSDSETPLAEHLNIGDDIAKIISKKYTILI